MMFFRRRKLLQERINKLEKELEEKEKIISRILLDFDNYRKKFEKEIKEATEKEKERILLKFIDVYENLQIACKEINDDGLKIILKQFRKLLEEEGIEEIESIGKKFDYNLHYAIKVEEGNEKGLIVEEIKKGYMLNGKVIRPSYVVVIGDTNEENNRN